MNAELKLYKDCTSEEPTKVFVCRRLIFKVAKTIEELTAKLQKSKDADEQEKLTTKILQAIFPDFVDDDLNYIDPNEYTRFIQQIQGGVAEVMEVAQKK
jgi:hypothetical protein